MVERTGAVEHSPSFAGRSILNLPGPIDTQRFKATHKDAIRDLWGLPKDNLLILFDAMNATGGKNKGFDQLLDTLQQINENVELESLVEKSLQMSYGMGLSVTI